MSATETSFPSVVVERSHELPIVVDFWADWCGPCHALAPVLEKAIEARAGAVELVKVDVDANPGLSEEFGIRGIPAVKAFRAGRVVSEFTGARSASGVDAFLDELLAPPRADGLVEELRASGELAEVIERVDADDLDGALALIVAAVPAAAAAERERLRDLAVALFERLGQDDPVATAYRRKLAAAMY